MLWAADARAVQVHHGAEDVPLVVDVEELYASILSN